jgi:hypothetical protein
MIVIYYSSISKSKLWTARLEVITLQVLTLSGVEGIKEAYAKLLDAKHLDIICLSENYSAVLGDWFDREFTPKLNSGFMRTREILPDTEANRNDAKAKDPQVHMVRFTKLSAPSESDIIVTDTGLTLISFSAENPGACIITDVQIISAMRQQFQALWDRLK